MEVLTLAMACPEGLPPADDIFLYDGCPEFYQFSVPLVWAT
jgi:hypothetical protein